MTEPVRVLIADDHPLFRDGLIALLTDGRGTELTGTATSGTEAVDLARQIQPDVVVMDLRMPGLNGIEATRRIVADSPHIAVLVLTMFDDDDSIFAALRAGARGYLLKGADREQIRRGIQAAASGEVIFGADLAERMLGYFTAAPAPPPFPQLTDREREVLELVARGQPNAAIAALLHLSQKTVRNNVSNILVKLQVADRAQAIVRARDAGLGHQSPPDADISRQPRDTYPVTAGHLPAHPSRNHKQPRLTVPVDVVVTLTGPSAVRSLYERGGIMAVTVPTEQALEQTRGFRWGEVPPTRGQGLAAEAVPAEPDLGGIAGFTGTFSGAGLNTIFRPQDFAVTPTPLPNPATGPNDNILEINLTEETLSFSTALGSIPNRGMVQGDAFLNGIPYLQVISDVSDPANPVGIHLEPGVWLSVPATTVPQEGATIVRMASIPHGTTIEAQGASFTVAGGPRIDAVDITPFPIGNPSQRIRFPSQTATDAGTFRLPQDLKNFITAGTVTQEILDNPNIILKKRADAQNITSTTVIVISTSPADPLFGGGTDNIAFLLGDKNAATPNADAVQMSATFWIETVTEQITVPAYTSDQPVIVRGATSAGNPVVSFSVTSQAPIAEGTTIDVSYTQIQYTQTVLLNFNGLTWPHVSVATLVPNQPVPVKV